jgi:hypothetical protein
MYGTECCLGETAETFAGFAASDAAKHVIDVQMLTQGFFQVLKSDNS